MSKIRIGIIGAGSIGSLFGGYLANFRSKDFQIEVIFFGRKNHIDAVNKDGLKLYNNDTVLNIRNIRGFENFGAYQNSLEGPNEIKFDYTFLTTKTYDTDRALQHYKKIIDASKWIILLQNGIGNEELLKNYVNNEKIIRIVTSHGAFLDKPGSVFHTGIGFIYIGFVVLKDTESQINGINFLKSILDEIGLRAELTPEILKFTWEKVFVNIGINAVAALTKLKNGELLEDDNLRHIMSSAVSEAINIAKKKKVRLSDTDFVELMFSVAKNTADNKNSMLQDILKGKRTEIDFINGKIVEFSKVLGLNAPINEMLTFLVKGLEKSLS